MARAAEHRSERALLASRCELWQARAVLAAVIERGMLSSLNPGYLAGTLRHAGAGKRVRSHSAGKSAGLVGVGGSGECVSAAIAIVIACYFCHLNCFFSRSAFEAVVVVDGCSDFRQSFCFCPQRTASSGNVGEIVK